MSKAVYTKLLNARKAISPYLQKANSGQQYAYVSASQVVGMVRPILDEHNLLLITKILSHNVSSVDKVNPVNGKETTTYFTELDLEFTWVDVDSGETLTIPFYSQGVDLAGEKGVAKALSYAEKNFFLREFHIATDKDDPDSFQHKVESTAMAIPMTEKSIKILNDLTVELAELRNIPVEEVIKHFSHYGYGSLQEGEFENIKTRLEQWIANAKKDAVKVQKQFIDPLKQKSEQKQAEPQQSNQQGSSQQPTQNTQQSVPMGEVVNPSDFTCAIMREMQYSKTPKGEQVATVAAVDENGQPLVFMVRESKLAEAKKLEGMEGQEIKVEIADFNGFKLLKSVG